MLLQLSDLAVCAVRYNREEKTSSSAILRSVTSSHDFSGQSAHPHVSYVRVSALFGSVSTTPAEIVPHAEGRAMASATVIITPRPHVTMLAIY